MDSLLAGKCILGKKKVLDGEIVFLNELSGSKSI